MGKTRLEELFYELYSSSNQHDSWQRYAMIRELRNLMKQPKASGSDSFERELDDEDLVETEVATELIGIEVATDPIETEHELVSQVVDSVSDVLLVHKVDSYVKEVEELPQKSTSGNGEDVAHQLLDQKPVRVTHKEKHMKHLKAWKFKFKPTSKRSRLMDDKFSFGNASVLINKDPQETQWLFNDELNDNQIFQSLIEEGSNSSAYQKFNGMRIGSHRLDHQKKLSKSPKSWKFKFKISLDRWLKAPCVKLETESFLEIESLQEDVQLFGRLRDDKFSFVDATVWLNKDPQEIIWDCVNKEFREVVAGCGKEIFDRFKLLEEKESRLDVLALINLWSSKAYELSGLLQDSSNGDAESFPFLNFAAEQDVDIIDAYYVLQDVFELVNKQLLKTSLVLQQVMRNKKIKFSKRWRFKYKAPNLDTKVFETSGSTHNFMDPKIAEKLGCLVEPAGLTRVSVADGNKLGVKGKVDGFKWNFQPTPFEADLLVESKSSTNPMLGSMLKRRHKRQQVRKLKLSPTPWLFKFKQKLIRLKIRDKESQIAIDMEHSSSSLRANQIWDPGGKLLYI